MALLSLRDLTHAFGRAPVLDGVQLQLEKGDRVCLFGRNGEGKSTLMRIIAGEITPDSGGVDIARGAVVGALAQEVPDAEEGSVFSVVASGLGEISQALSGYHEAVELVGHDASSANLERLEKAQDELEAIGGWDAQQRVDTVISKLGLDPDAAFASQSGGWRRRVFLARALVRQPDVLLLDEPTNHLDIEAIQWLEEMLARYEGALIFVSHDRAFVRALSTRIVELDRGQLVEYPGEFDRYVQAKEHALDVETEHNAQFDKKLAQEEVWIRQGIKARRTRNEGRVRALKKLRDQRRQRRERKGKAAFAVQTAGKSGRVVIEAKDLRFRYGDEPLIEGVDLRVMRGDRIALIGPNGVGKTTLLRLLLGTLEPQSGTVTLGTKLRVRYYDQLRDQLNETLTVAQSIVEKGDTVELETGHRHVIGYLKDFLFDGSQARQPVSSLSGGERNRLLLAKLFAEPANVLVLDEPTNDLDVETLELLEQLLLEFPGTVLLVSHDREFVDNLVTESLIFEGGGVITRVVGGYAEWLQIRTERRRQDEEARNANAKRERDEEKRSQSQQPTPVKRTRKELQELDELPGRIETLETEQKGLHELLGDPAVYKESPDKVTEANVRLAVIEKELASCYARWEELDS